MTKLLSLEADSVPVALKLLDLSSLWHLTSYFQMAVSVVWPLRKATSLVLKFGFDDSFRGAFGLLASMSIVAPLMFEFKKIDLQSTRPVALLTLRML